MGEADITKARQVQPGVSGGIEGFASLNVRGGDDDQNLMMIDGHPLYQMGHLGGLFSPFNVEAISGLDFYKSAFPARYGGRVSSVVDVHTRPCSFDKYTGTLSLGLTAGNAYLSGPIIKGRTAFTAAMRRSWIDLISIPGLAIYNHLNKDKGKKTIAGYSFMDLNGKINHRLDSTNELIGSIYYASDRLKIGENTFATQHDDSQINTDDINRLHWGNLMVSLEWQKRWNKLSSSTSLFFTRYSSWMQHRLSTQLIEHDQESNEELTKLQTNSISDLGMKTDFTFSPNSNMNLRFGAHYTHHHFVPENHQTTSAKIITQTRSQLDGHELGIYVENDMRLGAHIGLNPGLRLSLFQVEGKSYFQAEPRLSVRLSLSDKLSLKAGYAHMSQFVQQVSDSYISLPTDMWIPCSRQFKPLLSDQISAGAYWQWNNTYTCSVEGYYKWMHNLMDYKDNYQWMKANLNWQDRLATGNGEAYGMDFLIEKHKGRFTGTLGYGLLWTQRRSPDINQGASYPSKYDNRHKLNLAVTFRPKQSIECSASWMVMSGNRMTLALENYQDLASSGFPDVPTNPYHDKVGIDYYPGKNNVRLPAYHRLDLSVNFYRQLRNGRLGIWNISIYNAYCRMNPIVVEKNNDAQTMSGQHLNPRFRSLSIFPIIPSVSYTYKF